MAEKEQVFVTVPDFRGTPTRIPIESVKAFREQQDELKRRQEAGEPLETPEEKAEDDEILARMLKDLG